MAKTKEEKIEKPKESPIEMKKTVTAFLLMFPAVIVGFMGIVASEHAVWINFVIAALLILQFVMLEQFIKDFYRIGF